MSNEQRATSNEQRATSNEQRATSNEQRATSNEQRATSNEQRKKYSRLLITFLTLFLSTSLYLKAQCTKPNKGATINGTTLLAIETDATYQWLNCRTNNSPIANETNRSFTPTAPTANGTYAVEVTKNNCKDTSLCLGSRAPTLSATVTGKTISIPSVAGVVFYTWSNCEGGGVASGATATSYTATKSGSYRVEGLNPSRGMSSFSACVTVCFADKPTVTKKGNTLSINKVIGATYQWLDCGNSNTPIMGATDTAYTPTATREYAIEITRSTTCKDTSVCTAVTGVGLIENTFATNLKLYPNPTSNKVTIELGNNYSKLAVEITNILGQVITSKTIARVTNRKIVLPINTSSGIYFISIKAKEGFASFRVVKE